MHSIGRSGLGWIWNQPELENRVSWRITSECDSVIIYFIPGPIAVQCARHTHMPFWGRWQWSHKCHLRMAHARLADGSSACPRACNSCHTGEKSWKNGFAAVEKGLLSHGVSRGGAHQCPHAASQGIICTSVSTTLCQSKNQQKRILSHEKLTGLMTMLCTAYLMVVVVSKLKFTD